MSVAVKRLTGEEEVSIADSPSCEAVRAALEAGNVSEVEEALLDLHKRDKAFWETQHVPQVAVARRELHDALKLDQLFRDAADASGSQGESAALSTLSGTRVRLRGGRVVEEYQQCLPRNSLSSVSLFGEYAPVPLPVHARLGVIAMKDEKSVHALLLNPPLLMASDDAVHLLKMGCRGNKDAERNFAMPEAIEVRRLPSIQLLPFAFVLAH